MAKKKTGEIKLQIPAGQANPAPPVGPAHCRQCGLLHVVMPVVSMELLRQCIGVLPGPPPKLCLCECCEGGRWLARRYHGLPDEDAAA